MDRITLRLACLAAVAPAIGNKDVRFYLCGALVERDESGAVTLVGLDGHAMVAARDPSMTWEGVAPRRTILPRDFVLAILKAAGKGVTHAEVLVTDSGALTCTVGNVTLAAQAVDGSYPDWQSIFAAMRADGAADLAPFNPAVMGLALKASEAFQKRAGTRFAGVHFRPAGEASTGFALTYTHEARIAGVVMPLRETTGDGFKAARDAILAEFGTYATAKAAEGAA